MHRLNKHFLMSISVLVMILLMAGSSLAQNRAGFFLGMNFANQGGDMEMMGQMLAEELGNELGGTWTSSKGTLTGYGLGGYYTIQTSPTFAVQIEGQYIRRGTKLDLTASDGGTSATIETEFQLNYLEIPILARFSPNPDAKFRMLLMGGPVIGFKTGADLSMSFLGESESASISEGYTSTTVGLLGSLGFSAQVGTTTFLTVQGRYYMGMTNPVDDNQLEAKSGDFGIFVGMEFLMKK